MRGRLTLEDAETIAFNALKFLADSPEALDRFMQQSGVDLMTIRATATDRGLQLAVMDFFMANEELLVDFCESTRTQPRNFQLAVHLLGGA
jgi:Protein of unknown function (DUF3572)